MIKTVKKKNIQSLCFSREKQLDNFVKIHDQKKELANTPTQSIQKRVAYFEDMLQLTQFQPLKKQLSCKKKSSKSSTDKTYKNFISIPTCINNFFMMTSKTRQNLINKQKKQIKATQLLSPSYNYTKNILNQHQLDQNQFSEEAQMKKLNKMVVGIIQYDQDVKERQKLEKQRIQRIERNKFRKQNQNLQFQQFNSNYFQIQNKKITNQTRLDVKTALSKKNKNLRSYSNLNNNINFPLPTSFAKTQKQWHELKKVQIKMQEKRLFTSVNANDINNRFKSLKNKVKNLEYRAKCQFGLNFMKKNENSLNYQNQIKQLNKKLKDLEKKFIKRGSQNGQYIDKDIKNKKSMSKLTDSYQNLIKECDSKINDNTIPMFLLTNKIHKKSQIGTPKTHQKRAFSSNVFQKSYIKMI